MTPKHPPPLDELTLTIRLTRESDTPNQWTSHCLELDILSAGKTPERALQAVAEAVRLVVDYCAPRTRLTPIEEMRRISAEVVSRATAANRKSPP